MAAGTGTSAYPKPSAYPKRDLEHLWVQAGGDPSKAGLAASIALAESSGRVNATNRNTNGTIDRGLWQINSIHGGQSTFDPLANARAAVAISNNGRSFDPWVTYKTGAYRKYTGARASSVAGMPTAPASPPPPPAVTVEGGTGIAGLLQTMAPQKAPAVMSAPTAPQFSATSRYLKVGSVPASVGVTQAPKPSVADLLSSVQNPTLSQAPQAAPDPVALGSITASGDVAKIAARAQAIDARRLPYKWGGGHAGKVDPSKAQPLDCSGAVSAALGINPRVSGQFEQWGNPGDGGNQGVTIYANAHHVLMKIGGHFFGTSATNPGGGAGWIPQNAISPQYLRGFTVRHA
jgi:hypothetical protein